MNPAGPKVTYFSFIEPYFSSTLNNIKVYGKPTTVVRQLK